jgi:hypothetical protein
MKKMITFVFLASLIIGLFAACGGGELSVPQNGTYSSGEGLFAETWTFSGTNEISLSVADGQINSHGTWEINDGYIYVTSYIFGIEGIETTSRHRITEITRDSFFIDGTRFERQ